MLASSIADAEQEIQKRKPNIVVAESTFGKQSGLDLLQRQRENNPESKNCLFILLTGNSSQSAVARAARRMSTASCSNRSRPKFSGIR